MTPYEIAKLEFKKHITEIPGPKNNLEIVKYNVATPDAEPNDEQAWCAKFVGWCIRQARIQGYKCPPETRSAMARSYLDWGITVMKPKEGDIVVFWRGSYNAETGHVGFFTRYVYDDFVEVLGGNQKDSLSLSVYDKKRILAFKSI